MLLGTLLRVLFILFGAELYFNRENIFIDGDTFAWQNCIENLIQNGTYTVGGYSGEFSRMPGYSFFIGIFYIICNQNWELAFTFIAFSHFRLI